MTSDEERYMFCNTKTNGVFLISSTFLFKSGTVSNQMRANSRSGHVTARMVHRMRLDAETQIRTPQDSPRGICGG